MTTGDSLPAGLRTMPVCSVVVPVRNGAQTIEACIRALMNQAIEHLEVIVVDDGSDDDTVQIAKQFPVIVLSQPERKGPAAARNIGAKAATAGIVLFTDADCVPRHDWVAQMLLPFQDPTTAGCRGIYESAQTSLTARFVQAEYEHKYNRTAQIERIDFVDTYSAGYRREILLGAGGFDEHFPDSSVEDQELSFRLAADGHRLRFAPMARVEHAHPSTLTDYFRKKLKIGYYKPQVHFRHRKQLLTDSHTGTDLRLQTACALALCPILTCGLFSRRARGVALMLFAVMGITCLPMAAKVAKRDRRLALASPVFVFIRATALAAGLLAGTVRILRMRS